jgi:signal transduction histidine kinase
MCRDRAVQMLKGTNPRPYEYRVITKGGEVRWILETVVSTQYQGRRASLGNFMDITQRKQAVENLGRQTAVLEGINRIFRETLTCESEEELSRTCLKVAEELTGSKFGFINELNQEGSLRCLAFSDPGWQACRMPREKAQDLLHDLKPRGLFCKAVKDEQSFIANNPPSHPESGGLPEGHPPIASFMGVPLKHGGQTMGLIGLANKAGGFDPADQETLETLAVAIVEALMRFRAEKKAMSAGRLYRLLSEVNESIVRASDQLTLFQEVCRIVVESGGFRLAWIGTIDPDHQAVKALARYGFEEGYLEDLLIPLQDVPESRGPTGVAVREGRYDVCNDFATDPRMAPWREKALPRGYRSSAAFPLRVGSQVVGALTLYADRPGFFNREEIALLESMAADLSFAWESLDREVKRRRAEEALKESEERLRYLTSQLMTAQERERKRIAAELHDELGQALTVLKLHLRALERQLRPEQQSLKTDLVEILEYLGEVIENVRRLYRDLSPKVLEDLGLTAALQDLINDFADSYQLENLEVSLDDIDEAFPPAARTIIYRIFQEILNNIVKHSGCSRVAITLRKEAGHTVFKVEDNGKGFDAAGALGERGVGLTALEERVRMLGGNLDFWSRENQGTRVTFSIPIQ